MRKQMSDEIAELIYSQKKMQGMIERALDIVADMEDEIGRLKEQVKLEYHHNEAEKPGELVWNEVTGLHNVADMHHIAELQKQHRCPGGCELCDPDIADFMDDMQNET